jgi:hypothetical protein
MEKLLDMGNENVHDVPKKFEDTEYKEHEKTKKEINELRTSTNTKVEQRTLYKESHMN